MTTIYLLLLIGSAVCFLLAALGVATGRVNTLGLGLLLWVLVPLIQRLQHTV